MPDGVATGTGITEPRRSQIVEAISQGESEASIARRFKMSRNTVAAIRKEEWSRIEQRKSILAARCESIASESLIQLQDALHARKIPAGQLPTLSGIMIDKLTVLRGEPTFTIHHEHTIADDDKLLRAMHEANERAEKRAKARGIEVPVLPPTDASVAGRNG